MILTQLRARNGFRDSPKATIGGYVINLLPAGSPGGLLPGGLKGGCTSWCCCVVLLRARMTRKNEFLFL